MASISVDQTNPAWAYTPRSLRALYVREWVVKFLLACCGFLSLLVTGSIVYVLVKEAIVFFSKPSVSVADFVMSTEWTPSLGNEVHYGIWALVSGTILVSAIAMVIALPIGLVTAIYLSEYAPNRIRALLKPVLEILAGIPTVVYGFFALTVITPWLKYSHQEFNVYNGTSAGIAVGILCLPIVTSLAEDALRSVPGALREGAFGLGTTKLDVTLKVVLPAALSGIISSQEAFRSVPPSLREAALGMGATHWQAVWNVTLPAAVPGIMTGSILAMSRAVGEAAPIMMISGVVFITRAPSNLMSVFTVLSLQIYDWAGRHEAGFHAISAAAIIVLLLLLLVFNSIAIIIRQKFSRPLS